MLRCGFSREGGTMVFNDDKQTLISILNFIRNVLEELVSSHITEDKQLFQSAWTSEVRPRLDQLVLDLQSTTGEDNPRWREIQNRGLAGEQLKLKRARLAAVSKKGIPGKILDIINTILGSIPGADPIKEFKELVEEGLDDPNASIAASFS
jgi:hypothetical protein